MAELGGTHTVSNMGATRNIRTMLGAVAVAAAAVLAGCGGEGPARNPAAAAGERFAPLEGEVRCFAGVCVEDVETTLSVERAGTLLERFREEVEGSGGHPIECHLLAHEIGRAVARSGAGLEELFAPYQGECTGGYIHGALQVLGGEMDLSGNAVRFGELCERGGSYLARVDCVHGYGHAIGAAHDPSAVEDAVRACDAMRETDRGECAGGVLMQYYQDPAASVEGIDVALCERLGREEYQEECHRSRWAVAMRSGETPEEFAKTCGGAWVGACGFGLGYWIDYESDSVEEAFAACGRNERTLAEACAAGVVRSEVEQGTDDGIRPEKYRSVCAAAGDLAGACTRAEREVIETFFGK